MLLEALLLELQKKSHTFGWGAIMAVSQTLVNERLAQAFSVSETPLPAWSGRINLLPNATEFLQANGVSLGSPRLVFGPQQPVRRVALRLPIVAGTGVYRVIPGQSQSTGRLLTTQSFSAEAGYFLELTAEVKTTFDAFGNKAHVFIDLTTAADAQCNLWVYDEGNKRIAATLLEHVRTLPQAFGQVPVLSIDLNMRDNFSVKDVRVAFQPNPDASDDGALLVLMQLNDGRELGSMPGSDALYLIPADTGADLTLRYPVTWLVNMDLAPFLSPTLGERQPACIVQTSFTGGHQLQETRRAVPKDWAAFGTPAGTGEQLMITPATAELVAGTTRRFTAAFSNGTPVRVEWLPPKAVTTGAPGGNMASTGDYTADAAAAYLQDVNEVTLTARYTSGGRSQVATATVRVRKAPLMQQAPIQMVSLWRDHETTRRLQALSLEGDAVQWQLSDLPLPGERVEPDPAQARHAVYTRPSTVPTPLAVRWVQASQANHPHQASPLDKAGIILLRDEHMLNVEPAFVSHVAAGASLPFNVLEITDGTLTVPDGQTFLVKAQDVSWSVTGEGSITAEGVYTPAANPTLPFDVVSYDYAGTFHGYAVVQTGSVGVAAVSWESIAEFSLRLDYGNRAYANGGQQIPVTVKVMTRAVTDPILGELHLPISPLELASIRLIDKSSRQLLTVLEPTEEGLATGGWATSTVENGFDKPAGILTASPSAPQAVGDIERTRSRTLYVHTNSRQQIEVAATFQAQREGGISERIDSDSASYTGPNSVVLVPTTVDPFTSNTYAFAPSGSGQRYDRPTYWRGRFYDDGNGQDSLEAWYGMAADTTTRYTLSLKSGATFVSMGLIDQATTAHTNRSSDIPTINQTRWESNYLGDKSMSYMAFALNSTMAGAGSPLSTSLGLGIPLREIDARQRQAGLPKKMPANGPYPNPPASVPLFDELNAVPAIGALTAVLERRGDMGFDGQQAQTAGPVSAQLRDSVGNLHRVTLGFVNEDAQSSGRNELSLIFPASALPSGSDGMPSPDTGVGGGQGPQAPASSLHSNAFNFLSFLEGGVDPRTGQYTLQMALPSVQANNLAGPELNIRLGFDPFTQMDIGLGAGWAINLSQVNTLGKGQLRLSSGERYGLTAEGADGEYHMEERKLPVCRLFKEGTGYRLVHRNGTVEQLRVPAAGGSLALPHTLEAPTGHRLHFTYQGYEGQARLHQVRDDTQRLLLSIDVSASSVMYTFPAEGQAAPVTFTAELNPQRLLERLVLPTTPVSSWRMTYRDLFGYNCLATVHTPVGCSETIEYDDRGHGVPGSDSSLRLPRVRKLSLAAGSGQPEQVITYDYSNENFLGYGSVNEFLEEEDNLYRAAWQYTYSSTETHSKGSVERKIERLYNSLHLLAEEKTTQNGHVHTVTTDYHWQPGAAFSSQPTVCQLPKTVTTQWRVEGEPAVREEKVATVFDVEGNLARQEANTGVVTSFTYYPGNEDRPGCPKDPHGFTRYEETRTVEPSSRFTEAGAPTLITTSTYLQCPALPGAFSLGPVLLHTEQLSENTSTTAARLDTYDYYLEASDALTLGRLAEHKTVLAGDEAYGTTLGYEYRLENGEAGTDVVLKTTVTLTGFDDHQQVKYLEQSTVTGLMLLERDTNAKAGTAEGTDQDAKATDDVDIRRRYDALQRVVEETIAPGTKQEASKHYGYTLVDQPGQYAEQTVTDVKGLRLRTQVDGLGRAVFEYRREPGVLSELQTFAALYDSLGQLSSATEFDDFGKDRAAVAMTEQYQYDDWGTLKATLGADGIRRYDRTDPLGIPLEGVVQVRTRWLESGDGTETGAFEVTHFNAFEQPVKRFRQLDANAPATHVYDYGFDGLGRKVSERNPLNQCTAIEYDLFNRNVKTTLPDGATVLRQYACHSTEDLPTRIAVVDNEGKEALLGTQAFDGLDRMAEAVTGGRVRTFKYKDNQTQPYEVQTPKGNTLAYEYERRLGDQPTLRSVQDVPASPDDTLALAGAQQHAPAEHYEYDPQDARLVRCMQANEEVLSRSYHSNGRLLIENRRHGGNTLEMHYAYSVQERLLSYTSVTGEQQSWQYDDTCGGRLKQMDMGALKCTVEYDALGRDEDVITEDTEAATSLSTHLDYDAYGREKERCFVFNGDQSETLAQEYDALDRIKSKTLTGHDGTVLRHETFEYDQLGHLSIYSCTGPECPLDPYGNQITGQIFDCDALDNHRFVFTTWTEAAYAKALEAYREHAGHSQSLGNLAGNGLNIAEYLYQNPLDPVQLTGIINSDPSYPAVVKLDYDADGNLLNDEWGRTFQYDALGRLINVSALDDESPSTYHYDPLDVISARSEASEPANEGRFYCDGVLHTLLEGEQATVIVRAGEHLVAEQATGQSADAKEQRK